MRCPTIFATVATMLVSGWLACNDKTAPAPTLRQAYALSAPVEILIDDWGAAHIYADNKFDATYALCYQTAHDRLFQVDYTTRNVVGRLAEWFGDEKSEDDYLRKVIGFERIAKTTWTQMQTLAPDVAERLSICADGFNTYVSDAVAGRNEARMPPEYALLDPDYVPPKVTPVEIIAVGKAMAFELSFTGDLELLIHVMKTLLGDTMFNDVVRFQPLETTTIVDAEDRGRWGLEKLKPSSGVQKTGPAGLGGGGAMSPALAADLGKLSKLRPFGSKPFLGKTGSNNWVVGGRHTTSGYPQIANDPHLGFELPPKFYEVHLRYEEDGEVVDVQGITLAGAPMVLIGHNQYVAWGLTTTGADVTDLYLENINDAGDTVTWANGRKIKLINPAESICVRPKGGKVADCRRVPVTVRLVPGHGPLLNDLAPGLADIFGAISVRWTGFEPTGELIALDRLNRAKSVQEAIQALNYFQVGEQNFALADVAGNIGYFAPAFLPIRNWDWQAYPPYLPLPGDGRFEWQSFQPYDYVPQVVNPAKGYVVTANNDPLGTTVDNDPTNDAFYFGHFFDMGARAQRITTRIEAIINGPAPQKIAFEDHGAIQADVHSVIADRLLPYLLPLRPSDGDCGGAAELELCQAFDSLAVWDRSSARDSTAATIFHFWLAHTIRETFRDDIPFFDLVVDLVGGSESQFFVRPLAHWLDGKVAPSGRNYFDRLSTPEIETAGDILLAALRLALETGRAAFVDESGFPEPISMWAWERFHKAAFNHLWLAEDDRFTPPPYPFHGGKNNVDASDYNLFDEEGIVATAGIQDGGPNMRLVMEIDGNTWRVENALPGGASGNPDSVHYKDQLEDLWLKNLAKEIPYFRADVEARALQRRELPAGFPLQAP